MEHQRKLDALREWDDEEVRMLDKAVAKFPQVWRTAAIDDSFLPLY